MINYLDYFKNNALNQANYQNKVIILKFRWQLLQFDLNIIN